MHVNNIPVTIVGVTPADFTGVQQAVQEPPDVTVPLALDSQLNPAEKRLERSDVLVAADRGPAEARA